MIQTRSMDDLRTMMSGPLFFELFTFVAFLAINVFIIDRVSKTKNTMQKKSRNRLTNNCCTFMFTQSIREDNLLSYDTFFSLNNLLIQTIFCYVLCYFSTKMSFNASRFAAITYDSTWYEYPVEQQKCIIFMIERSQRSFDLSGYGIISCSMATFLSVGPEVPTILKNYNFKHIFLHSAFSYGLLLLSDFEECQLKQYKFNKDPMWKNVLQIFGLFKSMTTTSVFVCVADHYFDLFSNWSFIFLWMILGLSIIYGQCDPKYVSWM